MQWFGTAWPSPDLPAPICDDLSLHAETPVGQRCLWCEHEIAAVDRGILLPCVTMAGSSLRAVHAECHVRQSIGGPAHIMAACSCSGGDCDPDLGMDPREAALLVWAWLERQDQS